MKKLQLAVLAVVLAGVTSASAALTVDYVGVSPVQTIDLTVSSVTYPGPTFNFTSGVLAGIYNLNVNGVATPSFCIDVERDSGDASDYYYNDLASSPLAQSGPMGATAAASVEKLWAAYYTSATGDNTTAAALQLAIWETVAAGAGTYSVSIGGNSALDMAVNTAAGTMLANLGTLTAQADLVGLVSPTTQNYVVAVPEATTMLAGALLLLPLGASTLRIVRKIRSA